eukprot:1819387-Ditylum_brightwellii.AAC.1
MSSTIVPIMPSMSEHQDVFWFYKIKPLLDIFREVSLSFIITFGTYWAINEMTIQFFGRSNMTHHMKNKHVKEEYKWFVLACSKTSLVLNLTPDGRTASSEGRGLDETDKDTSGDSKIQSAIHFLVKPLIDEATKETKK